jgi:hypothetical protein
MSDGSSIKGRKAPKNEKEKRAKEKAMMEKGMYITVKEV